MAIRVHSAKNSDVSRLAGLLAELFAIETGPTPDTEKQIKE